MINRLSIMKKIWSIVLICLALTTKAEEPYKRGVQVAVSANNGQQVELLVEVGRVHVLVATQAGETIYEGDVVRAVNHRKLFDMSKLPAGGYRLVLQTSLATTLYQIDVANGQIEIGPPVVKHRVKTSLYRKGNLVSLTLHNLKATPAEVTVFNEYDHQLYAEQVEDVQEWAKRFDISHAEGRELTFVVKTADGHYAETIRRK